MRIAAHVKPVYGPTLPDLARARFGARRRGLRTAAVLLALAVAALLLVLVVRSGASTIRSSAGTVRFSFEYAGLRRERAPASDALLLARYKGSRLVAEMALAPLRLAASAGQATGVEPLMAANYMRSLAARTPGLRLQNTGPTIVNGLPGYNFTYTRTIRGDEYFGRVIFLTAAGRREGVIVSLLAQPVLSGIIGGTASDLTGALYEPGQGGVGVLFQPAGLLSKPLATLRIAG